MVIFYTISWVMTILLFCACLVISLLLFIMSIQLLVSHKGGLFEKVRDLKKISMGCVDDEDFEKLSDNAFPVFLSNRDSFIFYTRLQAKLLMGFAILMVFHVGLVMLQIDY